MTPMEKFQQAVDEAVESGVVVRLCHTHDMLPANDEAEEMFEEGLDPCIPVVAFTKETLEEFA